MKKLLRFLAILGMLSYISLASAHHSDVGIDESLVITLQGTVTEFRWKQPHVYLLVDVVDDGKPVNWRIQLSAINVLARQRGWNSKSLQPGDKIFVRVNPAKDGRNYGKLSAIERQDGSPIASPPGQTAVDKPKASSLDGNWIADRNRSGVRYPGGFDGFFKAHIVPTEAATEAAKDYDPLSPENPESTCVGRPTPAALLSSTGYMLNFDLSNQSEVILIRSEWFNELRTVFMDGREHPDASQTFTTGHSIGRWDGDTLIIDTSNFEPHRSPYQLGIPSSTQKNVVEKYRLIEDGAAMQTELTLIDPIFLAEPIFHKRILLYSPHLKMLTSNCDISSTSAFLK